MRPSLFALFALFALALLVAACEPGSSPEPARADAGPTDAAPTPDVAADVVADVPRAVCPRVGCTLPDFVVLDCDGRPVPLATLRGEKALWIAVQSGWCPVCGSQAPALRDFAATYTDRGLALAVVLSEDDQPGSGSVGAAFCSALRDERAFPFPVLQDPGLAVTGALAPDGIPTQVLVDRALTIRAIDAGWDTEFLEGRYRGLVEELLAE